MLRRMIAALFVAAAITSPATDISPDVNAQLDASGAYELEDSLPEESSEIMDRLGLDLSGDGIGEISLEDTFSVLGDVAAASAERPLRACLAALAITVLCAAGKTVTDSDGKSLSVALDTVSSSAAVLTVCVPAAGLLDSLGDGISSSCSFASVLVPVLSGLTAVSGRASAAAAYSAFTLTVIEGITVLTSSVLVPALRVLFAVSAVSALSDSFDLGRLAASVEKNIKWLLGLAAILLSGVLGISTVAAAAADNAATRAGRFFISGAVPVVGGVLSDAIGTVMNCLGIVRSTVGAYGVAAGIIIVLPSVLLAAMWMMCLNCTAWVAEALGAKRPAAALRSVASVISLALGLTVFTAMLIICSTAIVISMRSV